MKILFVTTVSNTMNAFLIPHIKMLVNQGHKVDVAFNIVNEVNEELFKLGCKIHNIEFQRTPIKRHNITAYKKLRKLILEEGYALVHTHTPVASIITRIACRNMKHLKLLYTAHGFHFYKGAPLKNWMIYYSLEKITSRWTDGIITMNEEDYTVAKNMVHNKTLVFKVNGVGLDLKKFSPQTSEMKSQTRSEYGYKVDDYILIYVGELSHRKHQDLLIKAVYHLRKKISNIKLLLVGKGMFSEEYQKLTKTLGLENNVEFLGFRKDISKLMILSDVAVSSSRQEGLPVNVMEAMATGLPLVVTNSRGNRDLVKNNENGFIVVEESSKQFADYIYKIYDSGDLRNYFSSKNKELVKDYSLENVLKEMNEIYAKV